CCKSGSNHTTSGRMMLVKYEPGAQPTRRAMPFLSVVSRSRTSKSRERMMTATSVAEVPSDHATCTCTVPVVAESTGTSSSTEDFAGEGAAVLWVTIAVPSLSLDPVATIAVNAPSLGSPTTGAGTTGGILSHSIRAAATASAAPSLIFVDISRTPPRMLAVVAGTASGIAAAFG